MINTPCFFDQTTVREATRYISCAYIVLHVFNIWKLAYDFKRNWQNPKQPPDYDDPTRDAVSTFHQITCSVLIVYSNYFLYKSTYNRNIRSINFWMIINVIYFVFIEVACNCFVLLRVFNTMHMVMMFIRISFESYAMYVICQFYGDETLSLNCNAEPEDTVQMSLNGSSHRGYQSTSPRDYHVDVEPTRVHKRVNPTKFNHTINNLSKTGTHLYL